MKIYYLIPHPLEFAISHRITLLLCNRMLDLYGLPKCKRIRILLYPSTVPRRYSKVLRQGPENSRNHTTGGGVLGTLSVGGPSSCLLSSAQHTWCNIAVVTRLPYVISHFVILADISRTSNVLPTMT